MGNSIEFFKKIASSDNTRSLRAKKNIFVSFICKGLSILISFLIVPLTLNYVGKVEYGIWMTISSIIQWFGYFDIGLGNGLRNKLAEALALNDEQTAKIYISSSFALITIIAFVMFILFVTIGYFISWNSVLNTDLIADNELFTIVVVVFTFFCIGFVLNVVSSVLQAMQQYALNDIIGLIAQLFGLVALYIIVHTTKSSLFYLCLVYSSKTAIVMLFASVYLFWGKLKKFRPEFHYISLKKSVPLMNLGIKFFMGQILYMIINETSLFLVVQFFGPADVTTFNLTLRYISIVSMGYVIVLTPFLSAFTEAFTKNETGWIKSTIKKITTIWKLSTVLLIIMTIVHKWFFHFWVGDSIIIPFSLILFMSLSTMLNNWTSTYSLFLNGIGKINVQLYLVSTQALLYIPLTYFFYELKLGLASLVIAQLIFNMVNSVILTIQYRKIISGNALGVWAK